MNIKKNVLVFTLISIVSVGTITAVTKEEARIHFTNAREQFLYAQNALQEAQQAYTNAKATNREGKLEPTDINPSFKLLGLRGDVERALQLYERTKTEYQKTKAELERILIIQQYQYPYGDI